MNLIPFLGRKKTGKPNEYPPPNLEVNSDSAVRPRATGFPIGRLTAIPYAKQGNTPANDGCKINREKRLAIWKRYREKHREELIKKSREYRKEHKEELHKKAKEYYQRNKEKRREKKKESDRKYYQKHKEILSSKEKVWRINNPEIVRASRRNWQRNHAIECRLRTVFKKALNKYGDGKKYSAKKYGIDLAPITKKLVETKPLDFNEKSYHIDHIKPLCSFDLTDPEQVKQAFAPENLQWLTAYENMSKGKRDAISGKGSLKLVPSGVSLKLVLVAPQRECLECGNMEIIDIDGRWFCGKCNRYI